MPTLWLKQNGQWVDFSSGFLPPLINGTKTLTSTATWTVPEKIGTVKVELYGYSPPSENVKGVLNGIGGYVSVTFSVSPGEVLRYQMDPCPMFGPNVTSFTQNTLWVCAGNGGYQGGDGKFSEPGRTGNGGNAGEAGQGATYDSGVAYSTGGGGGTETAGGAGGVGTDTSDNPTFKFQCNGSPGTELAGGAGCAGPRNPGGGSGGAGFWGGGGGGNANINSYAAAGGGGGSNKIQVPTTRRPYDQVSRVAPSRSEERRCIITW